MLATRGARPAGRRRFGEPSGTRPRLAVTVMVAITASVMLLGPATPGVAVVSAASQTSPVGALFTLAAPGKLGRHFCTASVVDSPMGDLAVTAAHCVGSNMAGRIAFVPDYTAGNVPDGIWTVTRILMDSQWTSSRDPDDDFAFLIVSLLGSMADVQQIAGGEAIGIDVPAGRRVELAGYNDSQDALTSCENTDHLVERTQLELECGKFEGGTSGSPFLAAAGRETVIGVLGGYEQGGLSSSVSYAARFNAQLAALYRAAVAESEGARRAGGEPLPNRTGRRRLSACAKLRQ
jgi:V8-like Glu-specific endopeptidase